MKFSVAAGAGEVVEFPGFNSINYMQEMTQPICYHAEIGETKQLIDNRDNKYYWVTKLKDGNCWMTQNLDFDVPSTLSSTTSNVSSASVSTGISSSTAIKNWTNDNTIARYHDPGDYYYNGPNNTHAQGSACNIDGNSSDPTLAHCSQFGTTGDSHYHVGNYYSWLGATVNSGKDLTNRGDQAPDSICPKGWQLPTGSNNGQFAELLTKYGVNSDLINGGYAIYKEPLYFVYGGYLRSSTLNYAGSSGYYWSSTVISSTAAFNLAFGSIVGPADSSTRDYGFSVRCVAE